MDNDDKLNIIIKGKVNTIDVQNCVVEALTEAGYIFDSDNPEGGGKTMSISFSPGYPREEAAE